MNPADIIFTYHERTKHHLSRYATGPETLDWDAQPNAFREFAGSPTITLPLRADSVLTRFADLFAAPGMTPPHPVNIESLSILLELSFGLSAWKEYGPDRWALRCNPSSGNLHPTEAYVVCRAMPGLDAGVYHYLSRDHILEQRHSGITIADNTEHIPIWIGLSSIHWREAWKYGERAFRYCQLDIGHALGALRYAAAALGWQIQLVDNCDSGKLAQLLGLDRKTDFLSAEHEDPDALLAILPNTTLPDATRVPVIPANSSDKWQGQANILDPHPLYRWPIINEVATATQANTPATDTPIHDPDPTFTPTCTSPAVTIIRQRRSAQHFDRNYSMNTADFFQLLESLLPHQGVPMDLWNFSPRIHPIIFVNRVEGVEPGVYLLLRDNAMQSALRQAMDTTFIWARLDAAPAQLPLWQLIAGDGSKLFRTLHCHQAIGADSCFAVGMLTEFDNVVRSEPWRYRQLHWEAGLLGQILYLQAESLGLRGTGIGCYFDDAVHELLGLNTKTFQTLYHFTVGRPLIDTRITTLPPYAHRHEPTNEDTV